MNIKQYLILTGESWSDRGEACHNATLSTTNPTSAEIGSSAWVCRDRDD